jgi:Cytochrome P460
MRTVIPAALLALVAALVGVATSAHSLSAPASPARAALRRAQGVASLPGDEAGPRFTSGGELIRPENFREWIFVTSGLGMTYNQPTGAPRTPSFTNVYVNPPAYRAFMKTGQWPDKTMLILEIRASSSEGSINKGGHFQSNLVVIEAAVKDETRYPGKWAYFDFGRDMKPEVAALATTERCYACHGENGAVDNTFVQFYPTLYEVAKKMGTLKPAFADAAHH